MRFNIFEGARRIQYLLMLSIAVLGVYVVHDISPRVDRHFDVTLSQNGTLSFRSISECRDDDATRYYYKDLPSGERLSGDLCFRTFLAQSGDRVVLNRVEPDGTFWGSPEYSSDTMGLQNRAVAEFSVPFHELPGIKDEARAELWKERREVAGYFAIAIGAVWLLGALLGWIVRGFLGIPAGRDSRIPT